MTALHLIAPRPVEPQGTKQVHEYPVRTPHAPELEPSAGGASAAGDGQRRVSDLEQFCRDMFDPEMYGYAVNKEIRNHARRLLGMKERE